MMHSCPGMHCIQSGMIFLIIPSPHAVVLLPVGLCRCALQEASQLQGEVQQLGQQVQDLAQQLLEAQNAKVALLYPLGKHCAVRMLLLCYVVLCLTC